MKGLKKIQQENIKAKLRSMPYSNEYKITSNMDFQHLLYMVFLQAYDTFMPKIVLLQIKEGTYFA